MNYIAFHPLCGQETKRSDYRIKFREDLGLIGNPLTVHCDSCHHEMTATHVDGSARLQTISREQNELYYDLIKEFKRQTGCPLIINTSFNVRGEPIVCSPEHALRCFMRTEMDYLVVGSYIIAKEGMKKEKFADMLSEVFEPD